MRELILAIALVFTASCASCNAKREEPASAPEAMADDDSYGDDEATIEQASAPEAMPQEQEQAADEDEY